MFPSVSTSSLKLLFEIINTAEDDIICPYVHVPNPNYNFKTIGRYSFESRVEVSFSKHVVAVHCNSRPQKKIVETKIVDYLETNNFS